VHHLHTFILGATVQVLQHTKTVMTPILESPMVSHAMVIHDAWACQNVVAAGTMVVGAIRELHLGDAMHPPIVNPAIICDTTGGVQMRSSISPGSGRVTLRSCAFYNRLRS
jgi:hypothetical protein